MNSKKDNLGSDIGTIRFPETPIFLFDEKQILKSLNFYKSFQSEIGIKVLYSIKALPLPFLMKEVIKRLSGFSVSSVFEARYSREFLREDGVVHFVSPGLIFHEVDEIREYCNFFTANSFHQLKLIQEGDCKSLSVGIRIHPNISFVSDKRYDPARRDSKLGVQIDTFMNMLKDDGLSRYNIEGIHIHSNCESHLALPLSKIISLILTLPKKFLVTLKWINLGGGYEFQSMKTLAPLQTALHVLRESYQVEVIIEPGQAIVNDAGLLVASVIDIFEKNGEKIAVLDTTVNHLPEVFEYTYRPEVIGAVKNGLYRYQLAGRSCLAGDLFGIYRFPNPLSINDKIIFKNVGAYSLVKAHRFNGINLPNIYSLDTDGKLVLRRSFDYSDFKSQWKDSSIENN